MVELRYVTRHQRFKGVEDDPAGCDAHVVDIGKAKPRGTIDPVAVGRLTVEDDLHRTVGQRRGKHLPFLK